MKTASLIVAAVTLLLVAAPAAAQDKAVWNLSVDDQGATLFYAIPETDDGGPSFMCQAHSGTVSAILFVERRLAERVTDAGAWVDALGNPEPWPGELKIASGAVTDTFPAAVNADEMNGGSMVEASLPLDSPVILAFGKTGQIKLTSFDESSTAPAAPTAKVRDLLKACAK